MDLDQQVYNIDKVKQYYNKEILDYIEKNLDLYFNEGMIFKELEPLRFNINHQNIIKGELKYNKETYNINHISIKLFISYTSIICLQISDIIILDTKYWDFSRTTSKYRNMFLDSTTKEVIKDINKGKILLINLNK